MDTVLAWLLPEFFFSSLGISRRRLALILGATASFMVVVAVICLALLGKEEQTARQSATRFAAALVHDDPAAAPPGAAEYVHSVRRYFGPVTSARVIGARNKGVNTGDNADTRAHSSSSRCCFRAIAGRPSSSSSTTITRSSARG
jgi:hypothetical protein